MVRRDGLASPPFTTMGIGASRATQRCDFGDAEQTNRTIAIRVVAHNQDDHTKNTGCTARAVAAATRVRYAHR